jgi:hypothetical protein
MSSRSTIFISHGNPEDNEFAGWLAARLSGAGYTVWIDLWHKKGHPTWEEIEEEIRVRSIRVVALVSRAGAVKPGFKDEVNAAVGVKRTLQEVGFIVPIRLDDISFHNEVPIQLSRLNFIDGISVGWGGILAELLSLLETDKIPKQPVLSSSLYKTWLARRKADEEFVAVKPERILSNWYRIESIPEHINFYSSSSLYSAWQIAAQALKLPKKYENGILCTFANFQDVRMNLPLGIQVKRIGKIRTEKFLSGESSSPLFCMRSDASRAMVDLLRQGFAELAIKRGLEEHQLSNRLCWYPRYSLLKDERIGFEIGGVSGSRKLLGRYKEFFWHYATSVDVNWTRPFRITASGHVLFSSDGEKILSNAKIAARLRRKAVRSKRNAWWRDVMLAYFSFLALGEDTLRIPMGGDTEILIPSSPIGFISPRKLEFDTVPSEFNDDPISDDLSDEDEFSAIDELDEADEQD